MSLLGFRRHSLTALTHLRPHRKAKSKIKTDKQPMLELLEVYAELKMLPRRVLDGDSDVGDIVMLMI